jgi:hypothetical protein
MGFPMGETTPASTANYTGVDMPLIGSGSLQGGTFDSGPHGFVNTHVAVTEGVPAQNKAYLSGPGVTQVGAPNQFQAKVNLAAATLQLTGHVSSTNNSNTDPALGTYVWLSTNSHVATISNTGLVTFVGKGSVTIECRYSRAANLPFVNATPSSTESRAVYATLELQIGN